MKRILFVAAVLLACAPARAQIVIDPAHKFSWGENIGWMNWADANAGTQGVRVHSTYLTGFIWCENVGWINLGDGPLNGIAYRNLMGDDAGVNRNPNTGRLTGLAWGENIGWVNFSAGALTSPPQPARIYVTGERRLTGFVWGENVGWINLSHAVHYVALDVCPADTNSDGVVGTSDISGFLSLWFADVAGGSSVADFNRDGVVGTSDISSFLSAWFGALSGAC
ncbi:MAG TPA: GC-type dockerin domain-anchored protein [Phycisphaerales bacterium]|nr:GC-type dockerin domain-anchored protein [Phycisphaerales bacterium]